MSLVVIFTIQPDICLTYSYCLLNHLHIMQTVFKFVHSISQVLNFVQLSKFNVVCMVILQLPSAICACQQVIYSIKVNDTTEETYKAVGSFTHTGPGIVKHNIHDVIFERNHNYAMRVQIESAGETSLSWSYFFSKLILVPQFY